MQKSHDEIHFICYTGIVFVHGNIHITRDPDEIFEFLKLVKNQLVCFDMIFVIDRESIPDDAENIEGTFTIGRQTYRCELDIHLTRPKSGLVTHIGWESGELAAEWRFMEHDNRTHVEINIEGQGGGLANSAHLRQMADRVLNNLKRHFEQA